MAKKGKTLGVWLNNAQYNLLIEKISKDGQPVKPRSAATYVKRHLLHCVLGEDGNCITGDKVDTHKKSNDLILNPEIEKPKPVVKKAVVVVAKKPAIEEPKVAPVATPKNDPSGLMHPNSSSHKDLKEDENLKKKAKLGMFGL